MVKLTPFTSRLDFICQDRVFEGAFKYFVEKLCLLITSEGELFSTLKELQLDLRHSSHHAEALSFRLFAHLFSRWASSSLDEQVSCQS